MNTHFRNIQSSYLISVRRTKTDLAALHDFEKDIHDYEHKDETYETSD